MPEQQPRGAPHQQTFQDAIFLHRDIGPLVIKHLDHDSKAALRLVSKSVKRAVDKTVRKVEINLRDSMPVDAAMALLNAGWDFEELILTLGILTLDDDPAIIPSGMLLLGGIRGWTNLKKLGVRDGLLDNDIFTNAFLSQGFLVSTSLESLELSVGLEDEHIKKLATLRWTSNLKTLNLKSNYLGPDSLHDIIKVSSALTSLNLSDNGNLASQGVAPLAALTNLEELDLSYTDWKGQGFAELAHSLTNLTSLTAGVNDLSGIHRHLSEKLSMPGLKKLDLKHCRLTPAFFSIKLDLASLETLCLSYNKSVSADGVLEAFKRQRLPSLKCLDLRECDISGDWLAEFVAAGHVVCPLLEELDLSSNRQLGVAALCNSPWKLKSLRLARCNLGSEEMKALAEGNFQWLQHLDLAFNKRLKAEDLTALASTANMTNIESIDIK